MASKGDIRLIISDPGSQLVCAAKELSAWRKNWDLEELIRFGTDKGLTWNFIMADSQHQNGAAESLIKVVKGITKSLMRVVGDPKLSLNELNTLSNLEEVPQESAQDHLQVQIPSVRIRNMQERVSTLCRT